MQEQMSLGSAADRLYGFIDLSLSKEIQATNQGTP